MKELAREHIETRLDRFIEYYAKTSNVYQSAVKAGYSPIFANKRGKYLVATAERRLAKIKSEMAESLEQNKPLTEEKKSMAELIGFNRKELMENVKWLGTQERDLNVRLKVVAPLIKEYGVDLNPTENNITIPVLTMNVNTEARNIDKPQRIIEPDK